MVVDVNAVTVDTGCSVLTVEVTSFPPIDTVEYTVVVRHFSIVLVMVLRGGSTSSFLYASTIRRKLWPYSHQGKLIPRGATTIVSVGMFLVIVVVGPSISITMVDKTTKESVKVSVGADIVKVVKVKITDVALKSL